MNALHQQPKTQLHSETSISASAQKSHTTKVGYHSDGSGSEGHVETVLLQVFALSSLDKFPLIKQYSLFEEKATKDNPQGIMFVIVVVRGY